MTASCSKYISKARLVDKLWASGARSTVKNYYCGDCGHEASWHREGKDRQNKLRTAYGMSPCGRCTYPPEQNS